MSVATLDIKTQRACAEAKSLYTKKELWETDIDDLLDRMNELNKLLTALHSILLNITFEVERDMDGFKRSDVAKTNIKMMVSAGVKVLNKVRPTSLFPGVKTTWYTLRQELSYLNELVQDRDMGLALESDTDMDAIIQATLQARRQE
ncbi:MAG: hypothetical protein JST90_01200 [Bacteroidetes bacterium]|nr:hypothetical protein [Bacteroidota bacterium]